MSLIYGPSNYHADAERKAGAHVFIVGVGSYPHFPDHSLANPNGQIDSAAYTAEHLVDWVLTQYHSSDAPLQTVRLLLSDERAVDTVHKTYRKIISRATWNNFYAEYREWIRDVRSVKGNTLIFFFSGHGIGTSSEQCLLLSDFHEDENNPLNGAFEYNNFLHSIEVLPEPKHAWLFIDACRDARLRDLATGTFGQKVNTANTRLAVSRGTPCLQVFSASPGQKALGKAGNPTFFGAALREVLEKNAYVEVVSNRWAVRTDALQTALSFNLKERYIDAGIPPENIPDPEFMWRDTSAIFHQRIAGTSPELRVKVTYMPETMNNQFSFSWQCKNSSRSGTRPPQSYAWFEYLIPGSYAFKCIDLHGKVLKTHDVYVNQCYVVVQFD